MSEIRVRSVGEIILTVEKQKYSKKDMVPVTLCAPQIPQEPKWN